MPAKKKKGGKKKKKGPRVQEEPEEDKFTHKTGEELETAIEKLREDLENSKIKRNMLQIEKDMIHDFYHNTREEIIEHEARIRNFDTKMQDSEASQRTEIVSHIQKVKHLEYEHQISCNQVKTDAAAYMKQERTHHTDNEKESLKSKSQMRDDHTREDMNNIADVDDKEKQLQNSIKDLRTQLEFTKKDLIDNYELKLRRLHDELELRMKVEIHEIEERKNQHINDLMLNHEAAYREMKEYYNDITRQNLELIKQHQERFIDLKAQTAANEQTVADLKKRVKEKKPTLTIAVQTRDNLRKGVKKFDNDVMALRNARGFLNELQEQMTKMKTDRENLEKEFLRVQNDKEDMYRKFEVAVDQLRARSNYKNEQLENKLGMFQNEYEKKELTLRELV